MNLPSDDAYPAAAELETIKKWDARKGIPTNGMEQRLCCSCFLYLCAVGKLEAEIVFCSQCFRYFVHFLRRKFARFHSLIERGWTGSK